MKSDWSLWATIDHLKTRASLERYYGTILNVLFTRMHNSKTETFSLRFVRIYHFVSAKADAGLGADFFINVAEQVQLGYVFCHDHMTKICWDVDSCDIESLLLSI